MAWDDNDKGLWDGFHEKQFLADHTPAQTLQEQSVLATRGRVVECNNADYYQSKKITKAKITKACTCVCIISFVTRATSLCCDVHGAYCFAIISLAMARSFGRNGR